MNSIGPFSLRVALIAAAVILAWAVAHGLARRRGLQTRPTAGGVLMDASLWGFVVARLAYIIWWWPEYSAAPLSMLAIGDGGFVWWIGAPVAIAWLLWRTRAHLRVLRQPVLVGIVAGFMAWGLVLYLGHALRQAAPPLPDLALETTDSESVNLRDYLGQPIVVNLWATWCPPCRREMPVFVHAQEAWPQVRFLLVNQGDERTLVRDYLSRYELPLRDVLLDSGSRTMQATGSRVLPTTLFFDAEGRLVDTHIGELTRAALADRLQHRLGVSEPP